MPILAINTASSNTEIAILDEEKKTIIAEKSWKANNDQAELLMLEIKKLMKESKEEWKNLTKLLVVNGPGSFTSLRIGIITANILAYLQKIKVSSINTFEYYWKRLEKEKNEENPALLIYAGQKGVYFSEKSGDTTTKQVKNIPIEKLTENLKEKNIKKVFGDISEDQEKQLKEFVFINNLKSFGETMLEFLEKENLKEENFITPEYFKEPSITKPNNSYKCFT